MFVYIFRNPDLFWQQYFLQFHPRIDRSKLPNTQFAMANPTSEIEIETENQRPPPATTTDSSFASTSSSSNYDYDVFISHRGPDTKKNLASHLYTRLRSHGIRTFLDQTELKEGLNFSDQIVRAIRSASVQVAMFSENFAASQWCLDELLMQESGAPILPIFYGVKPAELRWTDQNKSGLYAKALQQLEGKTTFNPQTQQMEPRYGSATVRKWRTVLRTVSDLHGFDFEEGPFNHDEGQMLNKVIQRVEEIMAERTRLYVAKHPTGLDDKVKDFETTVLRGKAQVVGIVGPGGMGKTTLAKEFFNRKCSGYNKSYFLSDVRENATSLHSLQSKLLYGLTQLKQHIDDIHQGTQKVKNVLSSFQVLLILDDIDHIDQVDALLPEMDSLCSNSLILITSRNIDVLTRAGVEESSIYKLKGLTLEHSRRLFCLYAFRKPYPLPGFHGLVEKFLIKCDGLPLALKVFGALLFKQKKTFWEKTLSQLEVPIEIKQKLKISYDALDENEQQIFLDIACFLIGEKRDIAIAIWEEHRFQNLESRCLVEVDSDNEIRMHDQLRDMGQEIALERGLWHPAKDIDDLAKQSSVITKLRGTRMFPWYQGEYQESWVMSLLDRLCNTFCRSRAMELQFLSSGGYLLERILRRLHCPNLIWLSWRYCPYSYLPSWIPIKNLSVLKVEGKVFQTLWQGRSQAPIQLRALEILCIDLLEISKSIGQLKHLKHMQLRGCRSLKRLPESFGNLTNLQYIKLSGCASLERLPESFGNLTNLQHMELFRCGSLERLPESFGNLTNLQHMELFRCGSLERLPESFGNLTNLQHMELIGCGSLERLPESFGNLTNLQHMELSQCVSLERLPESFGNLTNLQHMELSQCVGLERLPESFGNLTNLQHIKLNQCQSLERLPESFGNLTNLQHIMLYHCQSLERLPESFGNLTNLQHIKLFQCQSLERLPESFGNLTNLQHMELSWCQSLERLPESIGNLTNLQHMELSCCQSLERLPESISNLTNLQHMELSQCQSLVRLPESIGNLTNLQHMELIGCGSLERLPESFGNLTNLQHMELSQCQSLERLPESFGNLTNLQHMELSQCVGLERLPESFGNLTNLQHMELSKCQSLERLPESFGNLTNLQHMELSQCVGLERLPESFGNLTNLQHIKLFQCQSLERLPESFGNLTNLQHMELSWCLSLVRLPESFGNLTNLQHMELSWCLSLVRLPESISKFTNLVHIDLSQCPSLKKIIPNLAQLRKLEVLNVRGCLALEELDGVEHCISLRRFNVSNCPNLKWGEEVVNKWGEEVVNELRQQKTTVWKFEGFAWRGHA